MVFIVETISISVMVSSQRYAHDIIMMQKRAHFHKHESVLMSSGRSVYQTDVVCSQLCAWRSVCSEILSWESPD